MSKDIRKALMIASMTSNDPESRETAKNIAQSTYKVPTDTTFKGNTYFGIKPTMAASDVKTTVKGIPGAEPLPKNEISWDDFYKTAKGGTLMALGGDRSRLGRLTHINGEKLAWPVDLHAGADYMLEPNKGAVWANAAGTSSTLRNRILEASKRGPVYGAFTPMGPKSVDSSFQMSDAVLSQIAANMPDKKARKLFDEAIKGGHYVGGQRDEDIAYRLKEMERMRRWPGINNPEHARHFIKQNMPGASRSLLMKYMDKAGWNKLGFPHIGTTRVAITAPELLNVGGNMIGHRIVQLSPESISPTAFEHNTYPDVTAGKYVGDVPLVQRHYAAPDVMETFAANPKGKKEPIILHPYSVNPNARSGAGKMFEAQNVMQPINERMIESVNKGLEMQGQYGFADGGEVDNKDVIKTALRLGEDASSIPALNETKRMMQFHSKFLDEIRSRSKEMAESVNRHREAGNLPFNIGTRFTTEHSRANGLPPYIVTGHYVNGKNPEGHYGYNVRREFGPDDIQESQLSVKNPNLEKYHTPEEWENLIRGYQPMTGPKIVKATGGYIHDPERDIRHALLLSQMMKSGATLPAAVDLARQLKPGRR